MSLIEHLKGRGITHAYFQSLEYSEKDFIFFIMPFRKRHTKLFENYLKPLVKEKFQMEAEIATDRFTVGGFTQKIWEQICESRIVIADVSGWNANVLYELGLAHALSKKCIIMAHKKFKLPSDLGHIDCLKYNYAFFRKKKDINALENKLSSAIRQVLDRGKVEVASFDNWRQTKGPWSPRGEVLELSAPSVTPDAYYIWSPTPFSDFINIKFRLKFLKQTPTDFRIALFAKNPLETYKNSNHVLLFVTWESGGHRVDGLINGKVTPFNWWDETEPPSLNQQYYYDLTVDSKNIKVTKDRQVIILKEIIQGVTQFLVKPAYWGFSSVGGHFQVSELETYIK